MPKDFCTTCNATPSAFAYPEPLEQKVEKKKERVKTAVLSTTAANKARRRDMEKESDKMEVENETAGTPAADGDAKDKEGSDAQKDDTEEKTPEPTSFKISNPGRVTLQQQQFVSFAEQRYRPVLPIKRGIVMLIDSAPERPEELVEPEVPSEDGDNSKEPAPPKPFIWTAPN
jgi:26S proteasome regulatory subunit N2